LRDAACFHAKRWPYVNPLQDAQTDILLLGAGLKSPQQIVSESEQGGDVCEILSEIAEFHEEAEKHDLHFAAGAQEPGVEDPGMDGADAPPARTGGKNVLNSRRNGHARSTI
jgi:capsid protein